jgi:hypothetical protein
MDQAHFTNLKGARTLAGGHGRRLLAYVSPAGLGRPAPRWCILAGWTIQPRAKKQGHPKVP